MIRPHHRPAKSFCHVLSMPIKDLQRICKSMWCSIRITYIANRTDLSHKRITTTIKAFLLAQIATNMVLVIKLRVKKALRIIIHLDPVDHSLQRFHVPPYINVSMVSEITSTFSQQLNHFFSFFHMILTSVDTSISILHLASM